MARSRGKPKGKKINPTLFVFCEGDTEHTYVSILRSFFRLPSIQINAKIGRNNITSNYIKNYKKDKTTHKKDINYLMYDADVPKITERLKKIKDSVLLLSNPCIELWFLLHYKNHNTNNNCNFITKDLKNRNENYKKGVINDKLKNKLTTKINEAIKRAKGLPESKSPSTTVYKLLEKLKALG